MCWVEHRYHSSCSHFGPDHIYDPCRSGLKKPCSNAEYNGVVNLEGPCPECQRAGGPVSPSMDPLTRKIRNVTFNLWLSRNDGRLRRPAPENHQMGSAKRPEVSIVSEEPMTIEFSERFDLNSISPDRSEGRWDVRRMDHFLAEPAGPAPLKFCVPPSSSVPSSDTVAGADMDAAEDEEECPLRRPSTFSNASTSIKSAFSRKSGGSSKTTLQSGRGLFLSEDATTAGAHEEICPELASQKGMYPRGR
jgi:hypothetical protein